MHLDAGNRLGIIGVDDGRAGDIRAGLADWIHTAQNHVVHQARVELVPIADGTQGLAGKLQRGDFMQSAIGLAAAARGANMVVNIAFRHDQSFTGSWR